MTWAQKFTTSPTDTVKHYQAWWRVPVIPIFWKAEDHKPGQHSNLLRPCLKVKKYQGMQFNMKALGSVSSTRAKKNTDLSFSKLQIKVTRKMNCTRERNGTAEITQTERKIYPAWEICRRDWEGLTLCTSISPGPSSSLMWQCLSLESTWDPVSMHNLGHRLLQTAV